MSLLISLLISNSKQGRPMSFKRPHDVSPEEHKWCCIALNCQKTFC